MDRQDRAVVAASWIVLIAVAGLLWVQAQTASIASIPACQEDAVIVGTGEFHSDGRWDDYGCGPSWDDLQDSYFELFLSGQS